MNIADCRFVMDNTPTRKPMETTVREPVRICVVGSSNVDLTFRTARMPQAGETLAGKGFHLAFGGKGANQAVAAARLGANVRFVARIGDDAFGREAMERFRAEGLDVTYVRPVPGQSNGVAGIIVDDDARNCIVVIPGANGCMTANDIRGAAEAIQSADALLCQLEVPLEAVLEAFRVARAAGVRTILTPAPAFPLPDELFRLTDLLVPNETELEVLAGRRIGDHREREGAARALRNRGAKAVAVTLGEEGAMVLDDEGTTIVPAHRVDAVDTTGAGDAFSGSLAVFWAEGLPLREAARNAAAVAALAVTRLGAQTAFPTRSEVDAFIAQRRT
jgi:ribokinase